MGILPMLSHGRDARATHIATLCVIPGGLVVGLRGGVKTRIQTIVGQLEAILNDEGGVGKIDEIIFSDAVVFDRMAEQPAEESDVSAGANLEEKVGDRSRPRKSRIDHNHFG